jgi:hypothetical protein
MHNSTNFIFIVIFLCYCYYIYIYIYIYKRQKLLALGVVGQQHQSYSNVNLVFYLFLVNSSSWPIGPLIPGYDPIRQHQSLLLSSE